MCSLCDARSLSKGEDPKNVHGSEFFRRFKTLEKMANLTIYSRGATSLQLQHMRK